MMNSDTSPLDPPGSLDGADSGLPPTPPTMLQDGQPVAAPDLLSKKSSLSTPVNARSPPTPDPSPPRTTGSNATHDRPSIFTYPSSRAESFRTAREDPLSSEPSHSRSTTPIGDRLSTVDEDRGLGLAFEREDNDITPTHLSQPASPVTEVSRHADTTAGAQEDKGHESPIQDEIPDREWDTNLMRNVTVRRKRKLKSSPQKEHNLPAVDIVETASPSPSPRPRRTSALRERVQASNNSPVSPSIEHFAQSIGWPTDGKITPEEKDRVASDKRHSTSSMGSTMVEAKIIVTPPRRRQTLRHSGKNMAYHRDEGSPTPDRGSRMSNRTSLQSEDVPLHRLVHKRVSVADRSGRISAAESDTFGTERNFSTPVSLRSMRQRTIDSSAATLRHQESVRNVLQPAADILCRSNTRYWDNSPNRRFFSAPESRRSGTQYRSSNVSYPPPIVEQASPPMQSPTPGLESPRSMKKRQPVVVKQPADFNKSLPDLPPASDPVPRDVEPLKEAEEEKQPPEALMERVRKLVAEREAREGEVTEEKVAEDGAEVESSPQIPSSPAMPPLESVTTSPGAPTSPRIPSSPLAPTSPPQASTLSPSLDSSPPIYRGTNSSRGRSGERRRSSLSQDRASLSPEIMLRPSLDRVSTDETPRRSYEWRRPYEEHGRVSFDRSTIRTEEHAMARHLYATTPFSQFSDTPIEVSEATAVSIYPHNNHSLLVVQQVSRANSMLPEPRRLEDGMHLVPHDEREIRSTPTPPFVDARESTENNEQLPQPTLNFEPSTPPMQIALPQPSAVDSPLKNPRPPPEPPKITFIPPTPAEELEKQLVPGPPKRSDSHPQRRLSIVQKARRYSDNLLPTLLGRSSSRGRYVPSSQSRRTQDKTRVPTVNDEDGALHPFWRPRGFWDGFDESESESDEEVLPEGGDTSDIEPEPAATPKRSNTLGKKLTSGLRGSGGFLIGNSLGVERHGSNSRRHRVVLPSQLRRSSSKSAPSSTVGEAPKLLIHPPTGDISRHSSRSSLRSSSDRARRSWRQGRKIPGLKGYHVQYIGLSGVKERFRERGKEKRRERIRKSIGSRYYVE